jgi:Flp pilus assembly pilin Flp
MNWLKSFIRDEDGQDVVEYGLLIGTLCLVIATGTAAFGGSVNTWFGTLATKVSAKTGP